MTHSDTTLEKSGSCARVIGSYVKARHNVSCVTTVRASITFEQSRNGSPDE
jgi:hypothetical protein